MRLAVRASADAQVGAALAGRLAGSLKAHEARHDEDVEEEEGEELEGHAVGRCDMRFGCGDSAGVVIRTCPSLRGVENAWRWETRVVRVALRRPWVGCWWRW
ncbi:hypothetical protein PLESTM_001455500 [Pleodorina starrii]|nr:hypothetical protein PLESTM_001455500 [Pleodorina starrii]